MDSILFEKQEASLCAQHALNMLIQDNLFSVNELSEIARRLDREENIILDRELQNKESQNMNDSGFFSIQVISEALKAFDLELHNIEHPSMEQWKKNPITARAYLCNHAEHWFVLRRFGTQWFELNSVKNGPRLLTDTYVGVFLHQLRVEEYSIFVVQGILPESEADQLISLCPVEPPSAPLVEKKEPNVVQKLFNSVGKRLGGGLMSSSTSDSREDRELAIAMAMSMETNQQGEGQTGGSDDDISAAIRASLADLDKTAVEKKPSSSSPELLVDNVENGKRLEEEREEEKKSIEPENMTETPILHSTSQTSINELAGENETETVTSSGKEESGNTPSPEQQRKDREAFLKRIEKSD